VNFSYRTTDGSAALGPSLSTPIWLRLVVSQTSVAGYESPDSITWRLVGSASFTLPTNYYVGFAVSSNTSAVNTATFSNQYYLTNMVQRSVNLISWLRADVGVAYNSSNQVSLWNDQSANGYNASQLSSSNQPTLVTGAVNGLPVISFNPSSAGQFLQFPAGFDFSAGLSLFIVLNPTAMAANSSMLDFRNYSGGASSDQFGLSELNSAGGSQFYAYLGGTGSSGSFSGALIPGSFQLLEAIYDGVSSVTLYNNGIAIGTQSGLQTLQSVERYNNFLGQSRYW
jgi:hypothetical protein